MLNIPEGATITVTNNSSRAFMCGGSTILPHMPTEVDADLAKAISRSVYAPYFDFAFSANDNGGQEPAV